ncbi:MAG: TRAP transporter substrate-binding protein DctP [Chloroflexi bacterium]|nr:TRAP transporter substrate-binding protein DctP [Chloroflexota bacterium]
MKKLITISIALVLVLALVAGACASKPPAPAAPAPAPKPAAQPIELKAVTYLGSGTSSTDAFKEWVDRVNKRANGELIVRYIGGPEAIPATNQPQAVMDGAVDIVSISSDQFTKVPEAVVFAISELTPAEQRKNGAYEYMVKVFEQKANVHYLGLTEGRTIASFNLFLNKPINTPKELAGLRFRTTPSYTPFLTALGVVTVNIPLADIYTSMERGLIDGFVALPSSAYDSKWYEVTKYMIDHPFYMGSTAILMNLSRWNGLPQRLRDLLSEESKSWETASEPPGNQKAIEGRQKLLDAGVKPITFSTADAKSYLDLALDSRWSILEKTVTPEVYTQLRKLFRK